MPLSGEAHVPFCSVSARGGLGVGRLHKETLQVGAPEPVLGAGPPPG